MRQKLVAGNWKMHGSSQSIEQLLAELKPALSSVTAEVAVIPPYVYLPLCAQLLSGTAVRLGAQNVSEQLEQGAYTGEISADMLSDLGCYYVLAGHSERRSLYGETDSVVAAKVLAVLKQKLHPIVCVGESLDEREAGQTLDVVGRQLEAVLSALESRAVALTLAYEPVWAIGSGLTATPEQAQEVHAFIRQRLADFDRVLAEKTRVLYGGSVKAANAAELFAQPDIDGGLVGGASLDAEEFSAICRVVK